MQAASRGVIDAREHPRVPFAAERALTAGLLCGPGGAVAHVAAGGALPSLPLLLVVTALAVAGGAVTLAVAGARRLGWPGLLVIANGTQLALHHLLGAAAMPSAAEGAHGSHAAMPDHAAGMGGVGMLLAHLAVAVLLAGLARGVDASWWQLVRSVLVRLLPAPPVVPATVVVRRAPRSFRPAIALRAAQAVPEVVGPRGPPRGVLLTLAHA